MHQLGENESRIRKTVKGEIVLELMGVKKRSDDKYKKEICKVLGNKMEIKVITHTKLALTQKTEALSKVVEGNLSV